MRRFENRNCAPVKSRVFFVITASAAPATASREVGLYQQLPGGFLSCVYSYEYTDRTEGIFFATLAVLPVLRGSHQWAPSPRSDSCV